MAEAPQDYDDSRSYLRRERLNGAFELRGVGFAYDAEAGLTLDIPALRIVAGSRVTVLGPNWWFSPVPETVEFWHILRHREGSE